MNRIIGFMEVDLEEDRLEMFPLDFMNNLMEYQDPVQDIPTLYERELVRVGNLRS